MTPLCVAARTAILIDPDKSVRPCCSYTNWGKHIPNSNGIAILSKEKSLSDIVGGEVWQRVQQQLDNQQIPEGCMICMQREQDSGFAMRKFYDTPNWNKGLTFLELSTSNLCTLQCRHCGPFCSHRWALETGDPVFKPDSQMLLDSLRKLNLNHLERLMFKGGEPLMNSDVTVALDYLREIGRLKDVEVWFVTNGTIVDQKHVELLKQAKRAHFTLSVDGVGKVQTYIRHGKSELSNVEHFIDTYSKAIKNVTFNPLPSIMAYNAFSLDQITNWWQPLVQRYGTRLTPVSFHHFVVDPKYLSLHSLRDATRQRLIDKYTALDPELYKNVIQMLRLPYAGDAQRAELAHMTMTNDKILGISLADCVPELVPELAA